MEVHGASEHSQGKRAYVASSGEFGRIRSKYGEDLFAYSQALAANVLLKERDSR
jgi:hypothetical protein